MKKLSIALSLVLCAVLLFALGAVSLAAEEAPVSSLAGEYTLYSTNYIYGEEVDAIGLELDVELDPETVSAEDFEVYTISCGRKSLKEIKSVEVDGNTVTIAVGITGTGVNIDAETAYSFDLVGTVADKDGNEYNADNFVCVGQVNPAIDQFIEGETENMKYRLFVPEDKDGESAPMLVWLHGGGEFGTENRAQLSASSPTNYANPEIQELFGGELYVLCPQSPAPKPHITTNIMETIYDVCAKYDIDMSRIYVAGCSQGGKTTIELVSEYPTFFAAAVSNCPYQTHVTEEAAKNLTDLPIIFLHATNDTTAMPYESIISYDNLRAAGNDNAWCLMYSRNPANPVTGQAMMGHWSWTYVHNNPTTTEEYFINGEGVYTNGGVDYPYVSTPLSEIGEGYDTLWQWVADQQRDEVVLNGDYTLNSTVYYWGEEVDSIDVELASPIDADSVSVEDFAVRSESLNWMGRPQIINYTVKSVEVNDNILTLNLNLSGTGVNSGAVDAYKVDLVGSVTAGDVEYTKSGFKCVGQISPLFDQFVEGKTDKVQYRIYAPETDEKAPLYIWLHGAGEFGTDNRKHVVCSNLVNWINPEVQDIFGGSLYVAAIQTPSGGHKAADIMGAIEQICDDYNIDMNRIYIAGCSMGGAGVHTVISAYPDFFAAAIPNCPASTLSAAAAETLVDLPIMYVHALSDATVNVTNSINSYNRLVAAGSDNVWCAFFEDTGTHDITGKANDTHWSWRYIHSNFTCDEDNYVIGEGVYNRRGVDYPYTSVDLADLGYANIASWLAAQSKLIADFNFYSTCYDYGEEVNTVVIDAGVEFDLESLDASDFEVYFEALSCGSMRRTNRTIESFEVDGTKLILNLKMTGSGTNAPIGTNFHVNLIGEIKDVEGRVYLTSDLTCLGQINVELDQFQEFVTEDVQYRLYAPEAEGEAPLYIWLHGAGEFGTDNRSQVSCSSLVNWIDPSVQDIFGGDLYVMAIQSPTSPHVASEVMDAIMDVCTNYDIDMSRIYLAGCSMGGMGVHTMITAYPDFFAAAIPNCPASTITAEQAELLVDLPILYVHAADDTTVRLTNSINSYNNIVAAGSDNIWCAFFENAGVNPVTGRLNQGHWSWTWIHNNFTSTEDAFISGEGVYTYNRVDYPYVSTPLSEIGEGYGSVAAWLADQQNENVIYIDNFTTTQGEEIAIPVYVDNAADLATFRLQLNTELLTINDVVVSEALDAAAVAFEYNVENGKITWAGASDIDGDALLFTIYATVADPLADGEYVVGFDAIDIMDSEGYEVEYTLVDAFMTVVNPHYAGDVTLDGSITNADVIALARYLVNLVQFNEEQLILADFDGDGMIKNADLIKLARYIVS